MSEAIRLYDQRARVTSYVGIMIALCSWCMLFLTLVYAYWILRAQSQVWNEYVLRGESALAFGNTLVVLVSSFFYMKKKVLITTLLGCLFIALQVKLWANLLGQGINLHGAVSDAIFYVLTGFHFTHMVMGVFLLLVLMYQLRVNDDWQRVVVFKNAVGWFWHLLTIAWVILFVMLFVL